MNRGGLLPAEMLHCMDMTVLERQRARFKWQQDQLLQQQQVLLLQQQQQQQQESFFSELSSVFHGLQMDGGGGGGLSEVLMTRVVKPDPGLGDNGCPELVGAFGTCGVYGQGNNSSNNDGFGFEMNYAAAAPAISGTSGCPPPVVAPAAATTAVAAPGEVKATESVVSAKMSSGVGRESLKKRKADKALDNTTKVAAGELTKDKKAKGCAENGDSKITEKKNISNNNKSSSSSCNTNGNSKNTSKNKENSADTSKDNSKVTEVQKPDYICVRARRGQATDSHSLAERVRREKISERMKCLQDLVPGCNKITGKAGMLDEIINYVQSLQRQVEFLSMKLAAVNPRLDFSIDSLYAKEAFPSCSTSFPTIGTSSDMTNPGFLQFNAMQQQMVTCCGLDMGINPADMGLRRTIAAPGSVPETFLDNSCFPQIQPSSNWDADLQNLYTVAFDQGRTTILPSQPFTGAVEASNLKMEM